MSMDISEVESDAPQSMSANYTDYWGSDESKNHYLPDGKQYFVIKKMNEGEKASFQKMTNQDMVVGRNQEARVKVDPAAERHALITTTVIGWNLMQKEADGEFTPAVFSKQMLKLWLDRADPKIVEDLEYEIRLYNPWMLQDMPVEEIDKEMERLAEMKQTKLEEEARKGSSATS